jgi:long-subunit fatty acid transport protein
MPMKRTLRASVALCAATVAAGVAAPAGASPLFELVGGQGGSSGLNPRVTGAGAASTYFNPALLADAEKGLELGIFVLSDGIDISVDPRDSSAQCHSGSCDVPSVFGTGPESFRHADGSPLGSPTVPTDWLENGRPQSSTSDALAPRPRQGAGKSDDLRAYQVIGLVSPVFGKRLVLGFYAMVPLSEFTTARAFYNDEREQFFSNSLHPELYDDRLTATSLAFGAGSRITDTLSVGMALTLSLTNSAQAPVYVSNLSNLDTVLLDSDIGVQASVAPHFGLAWDAAKKLRLTATVHTKQAFEIDTGFRYFLATGSEQAAEVHFTHDYMPLTVGAGAEWKVGRWAGNDLSVVGTTEWAEWSDYEDRHSERPHDDYAWSDTLSGALGARLQTGALASFVDVAYQPSPVPDQTGRSNYVDNDRVSFGGGVEYRFSLWGGHFKLGAQLQAHDLLHRHVTKFETPDNPQPNENLPHFGDHYYPQLVLDEVPDDAVDGQLHEPVPNRDGLQTNNPGFPGFSSGGWLMGASINLTILY